MSSDPNSVDNSAEPEITNPIIVLPPTARTFEAAGHKYFVESNITIARYKKYQRMEIELGFNLNFSGLVDGLMIAYNALNDRRDADAAVAIKEMLDGCRLFNEDRANVASYVATLFINRADEKRDEWSIEMANEKLEHWKNIDANFFLSWGLVLVREFPQKYKEIAEMLTRIGEIKARIQPEVDDSKTGKYNIVD